jgi:hypothetical protein
VSSDSDGGTVEEDEVVVAGDLVDRRFHLRQRFGQRVLESRLALRQVDELDLRTREIAIRGHDVEAAGRRRVAHVGDLALAEQHLVDGALPCARLSRPCARRRVALRDRGR